MLTTKSTFLVAFALLTFMNGCVSPTDGAKNAMDRARHDSVSTIVATAAKFESGVASGTSELEQLRKELPKELDEISRKTFDERIPRIVAAAGAEARCTVQYTGVYIGRQLRRLALAIVGETPAAEPPTCCSVAPLMLSVKDASLREQLVVWSGFGFREPPPDNSPISVAFVDKDGKRTVVGDAVTSVTSEYIVSTDLSRVKSTIPTSAVRLALIWSGSIVSEIPILAQKPPVEQETSITLSKWTPFFPPLVRGDSEFDGKGPKMTWSVSLSVKNNAVVAIVCYKAMEWEGGHPVGDQTTADGCVEHVVYQAEMGDQIIAISGPSQDNSEKVGSGTDVWSPPGKIYPTYMIYGDGHGDDVGVHTRIEVPAVGHTRIRVLRNQQ
jgi:hypothetical protein